MAEAILGVLLENVNSLLQNGLALVLGVDEELRNLSSTLTAIQAVLADAEEQQMRSLSIKDWLRKIKEAACVVDDNLDEYSIESTRFRREGENSGSSNKVHGMSLSCLSPKSMWFRYKVGKRMKKIVERLNAIAREKQNFQLQERVVARKVEVAEWRQTSSTITQFYGRGEDREKVVEFLLSRARDSNQLCVYSIVGLGGLGKTALAQQVFNDERVKRHFDTKLWVCVSEHFSRLRILRSIIESMTRKEYKLLELDQMEKRVQELLQTERYLLVLDDVWNENQDEWDKLKSVLACGLKGTSILVTSRLMNVAFIMGTHDPHQLLGLSDDDNWSLFKQRAFGPNKEEREELVAIGKEIVKKCGGSPLAAKTLGSLLLFTNEEKEWIHIRDSKLWDLPQDESSVLPALRLSYFNLKAISKHCFSLCAIFPKGREIMKEDLIHLWIANGFISSMGAYDVENVGNDVWNDLYQRSFFQDVKIDEFGYVESFKIHDLVLDLAQSISGEECHLVEDADLTNLSTSTHHVSYLDDWVKLEDILRGNGSLRLHKAESLRTHFQLFSKLIVEVGSPSFRSIRALKTSAFLPSSLNNLIHLRYLCLNCDYVTALPRSICSLRKLQILKLEKCWLFRLLPEQLTCLRDLRHLILKDAGSELLKMPPHIGKLTCLRRLTLFVVGTKTGYRVSELHDLDLGGDLQITGLENVPSELDATEANLISKKDLVHLHLSWGKRDTGQANAEQVLGALEPHPSLKSLKIWDYKGLHLPDWMRLRGTSVLKCLVSFELLDCVNCQQLPPLGKLPSLKRLNISGMKNVQHIDDNSYDCVLEKAFPSLKKLTLRDLPNLESVLRDKGPVQILPSLSELGTSGVPKFMLPGLPSVEQLKVTGCNEELLKSISNYHGLNSLKLHGNEDLDSLPEGMMRSLNHLKTLVITDFLNLKVLPTQLTSLNSLEDLYIESCPKLESFPEHVLQAFSSLRTLSIKHCEKFNSLSESVRHLTSLENLTIFSCPMLVALPSNMNQLTSLSNLEISGWNSNDINRLPEGLERIPCLQSLEISCFKNLASLPDCLGDLTSLQQIKIRNCPELSSLPSGFQRLTNLQKLYIHYCPKLEKQCKKGSGEDWHKIKHVQQFHLESPVTLGCCEAMGPIWMLRKALTRNFVGLISGWGN